MAWTIPLGQLAQNAIAKTGLTSSGAFERFICPITLADLIELGRRRPHVRGKDAYAKYDALLDRFSAEINEYLDELIAGQRSPYSFLRGMQAAVRAHYPDFYGYGQQVLDPKAIGFTQEDLAAIKTQQQREFGFLGKWYAQLKEKLGGPYEKQAIEEAVGQMRVRADLYAQAGRTLFFQGQVSLVSETTLIWWNLWPPAHHCWRCPEIAAGSPYTKRILPTLPGHDVPCMRRCKCFLTFGLPATLLELAILEADPEFVGVMVQWSYVRELHYGPGPHPGTGTPQSVHGRGGGKAPPTDSKFGKGVVKGGFGKRQDEITHIASSLPQDHLDAVRSIGKSYMPNARGSCKYRHIKLSTHPESEWSPETLVHEIGHALLERDTKKGKIYRHFADYYDKMIVTLGGLDDPWVLQDMIDNQQRAPGFPSIYSQSNIHELFSESYTIYVQSPKALQDRAMDLYEYMRDNVFDGVEYTE